MTDSPEYDDLLRPDPMTARFGPHGFMTQHTLRPKGSAAFLTAVVRGAALSGRVPDEVRLSFERVRELFRYGVFRYDFFTLADQAAWTLPETALGVRFIEFHRGEIGLERNGAAATLTADRYRTVVEQFAPGGSYEHRKGWRLTGTAPSHTERTFNGSYQSLMDWAYSNGLLSTWLEDRWRDLGQGVVHALITRVRRPASPEPFVIPGGSWTALSEAERRGWFRTFADSFAVPDDFPTLPEHDRQAWLEDFRRFKWEPDEAGTLVKLRNLVAHADAGTRVMPTNAADAIKGVAAFINSLWPEATPEGDEAG